MCECVICNDLCFRFHASTRKTLLLLLLLADVDDDDDDYDYY